MCIVVGNLSSCGPVAHPAPDAVACWLILFVSSFGFLDARPMGGTLWRYGTQEEGCTNHSFIYSFDLCMCCAVAVCYRQAQAQACS
jgi:hypothetical protein